MNILHKILNNVAMLFMVVIVGGSIISCDSIDRGTYEGDFAIRTQKDLKEIAGYSKITGSLGVQDDDGDCNFLEDCKIDLEDLDLLGNLTSIGGNLTIHDCPILENLDGLKNLTSIGGDLRIGSEYEMDFYYDTASLTNIKGLSNLKSIGGDLVIQENDGLTSLEGLNNLTSINGYVLITNHDLLTSLDALSNIETINIDLIIRNNGGLTSLGLTELSAVDGNLKIYNNTQLPNDLAVSLGSQAVIGGETSIYGNQE